MKLLKFVIPLLLMALLPLAPRAEHLPEDNVIGREMIVEKDSNIVDDMINGGEKNEYDPIGDYSTFKMTRFIYVKRAVMPFLQLVFIGIAVFAVSKILEYRKQKKPRFL